MRKSIFELIENDFDLHYEIIKIDSMFSNKKNYGAFSIEEYIDALYFSEWKYRGTFLSIKELRKKCRFSSKELSENTDEEKFLGFLELVINMIFNFYGELLKNIQGQKIVSPIIENIDVVLNKINYEYKNDESGRWIIVEKNSNATTVAEITKDTKVIEYNHYLLKGNIKEKRDILKLLSNRFEEIKKNLNKNGYENLSDDMGYLLNNLGIRHSDDRLINDMKPKELEEWYDKTYDMFLLCILANNHVDIKKEIRQLKTPDQAG